MSKNPKKPEQQEPEVKEASRRAIAELARSSKMRQDELERAIKEGMDELAENNKQIAERLAEKRRAALRATMKRLNLNPNKWAARAGLSPNVIYNFLNGTSVGLNQTTIDRLAEAVGMVPAEILQEGYSARSDEVRLTVRRIAFSGMYFRHRFWDSNHWYWIALPNLHARNPFVQIERAFPKEEDAAQVTFFKKALIRERARAALRPPVDEAFAVEVWGDSMDLVFPSGTIVVCEPIENMPEPLKAGDYVIAEAAHPGPPFPLYEWAVYQFQPSPDGEIWLWRRSSNPGYQAPIQPTESGKANDAGDSVTIIARVYSSYRPELSG